MIQPNIFKLTFTILLILAVFSMTVNAQQVISLQQAVDSALQNNLTIKQAKINEALGNADYQQAKYNRLPSVSANPQGYYSFGRNSYIYPFVNQSSFNLTGQASLSETLFQGGQLRNQIYQNKLMLDVDKTSTAKVKNDLLLNVVTDYVTILTDQDLVLAANQQIGLAKISLDRTQKNFDAGNQTRADLEQAKAQVSTAEYNLTNAQNQVDLAILVLKQYMEMNPAKMITIEKPDISKLTDIKTVYDATEVIRTAFATNPDIRLAELQQQTYAQAIKIAKGNYYPTVSLFGALGTNYSSVATIQTGTSTTTNLPIIGPYSTFSQISGNFNQSIGISLQIPIFNRFTARTSVRKAKLNYQYAELTTALAKNTLSKTIIQAVLDLNAAEKSYQSALQTFESNKAALNITKQRFDARVGKHAGL